MSRLTTLKTSFNDRNGKLSSKRIWAAVVICNGLLITQTFAFFKILKFIGYIETNNTLVIPTTLILGILGVGAGLFGTTIGERENVIPHNHYPEAESPDIVIMNNSNNDEIL